MKIYLSLEMTLRFAKVMSSPMLGFPLPPNTERIYILRHQILKILSLANGIFTIPAMLLNMYQNRGDLLIVFLSCTDFIAVVALLIFATLCHTEENRLKVLLAETAMFVEKATNEELVVLKFYMEKCSLLHTLVMIACVFGLPVYILSPLVSTQPLPAKSAYPFPIELFWIWALLYASQTLLVCQALGVLGMSILLGTLTWFATARFDILCMEIKKSTDENDLKKCIRKHQESLDFADRLATSVGRMAFAIAASNFIGVTCGGVVITYRQFYSFDFVKLMVFIGIAMVHLYLYAWPADYLTQLSRQISESILHGQWIGKSPKMHSSMLIMMLRASDPVVIKVDGLLPALNLETFGTGLSTSFSYVATLLAIFRD